MYGIFTLSCAREMLITDLISSLNVVRKHLYLKGENTFYIRDEIKHKPHPDWSCLLKTIPVLSCGSFSRGSTLAPILIHFMSERKQ